MNNSEMQNQQICKSWRLKKKDWQKNPKEESNNTEREETKTYIATKNQFAEFQLNNLLQR